MTTIRNPSTLISRKEAILSRRHVEGLIADGRNVIIVDGKVLKVDAWLKYHPGGDKAIMHMVGRDATDEVNAYATLSVESLNETDIVNNQVAFTRGATANAEISNWKG